MHHRRVPAPSRLPLLLTAVLAAVVAALLGLFLVRDATYREAVDVASALPAPAQSAAIVITEHGIPVLLGLLVLAGLHAGRRQSQALARGLAAGVGVVMAYLSSETLKLLVTAPRPCRTVAVPTIADCPPVGDWSWPSNHATVAAAIAVAVLIVWRRLAIVAIPLAAAVALSRVVLGVHHAHDVLAGALLGTVVVLVCARVGAGPVRRLLAAARPGDPRREG